MFGSTRMCICRKCEKKRIRREKNERKRKENGQKKLSREKKEHGQKKKHGLNSDKRAYEPREELVVEFWW